MDINNKITGDSLTAPEFNQIPNEIESVILASGQAVDPEVTTQLSAAIAQLCTSGDFFTTGGTANAIILGVPFPRVAPSSLVHGLKARFVSAFSNTSTVTANICNLGSRQVTINGNLLSSGSIIAGQIYELTYIQNTDSFELFALVNSSSVVNLNTPYCVNSGNYTNGVEDLMFAPGIGTAWDVLVFPTFTTNTKNGITITSSGFSNSGSEYLIADGSDTTCLNMSTNPAQIDITTTFDMNLSTFSMRDLAQYVASSCLLSFTVFAVDESNVATQIGYGSGYTESTPQNITATLTPAVTRHIRIRVSGNPSGPVSRVSRIGMTGLFQSTVSTATNVYFKTNDGITPMSFIKDKAKNVLMNFASSLTSDAYGNTVVTLGNPTLVGGKYVGDGTGDGLLVTSITTLGAGLWTIEGRFKANSLSVNQSILYSTNIYGIGVYLSTAGKITMSLSSNGTTNNIVSAQAGSTTLVAGTEYHVAIVFDGNTYKVYVNGVLDNTVTSAINIYSSLTSLTFGIYSDGTSSALNGTIDDLRITVGQARYTSNFTPPAVDSLEVEYDQFYYPPTVFSYAGRTKEVSKGLSSISGMSIDGQYSIVKESGNAPISVGLPRVGKDLFVDFSQFNANDCYGLHNVALIGAPVFANGKFNSNGVTGLKYTIASFGSGAWCVQGKYKFATTTVQYALFSTTAITNYQSVIVNRTTANKLAISLSSNLVSADAYMFLGAKSDWTTTDEYYIRARYLTASEITRLGVGGVPRYEVQWSTDYNPLTGAGTWTTDISINSTTLINSSTGTLNFGVSWDDSANPLNGTMDDLQLTISQSVCQIKNQITRGKTFPLYPKEGDLHCLMAGEMQTYKYTTGFWGICQFAVLGSIIVLNGTIYSLSTNPYNQNGYDTLDATIPDYINGVNGVATVNTWKPVTKSSLVVVTGQGDSTMSMQILLKDEFGNLIPSYSSGVIATGRGTTTNSRFQVSAIVPNGYSYSILPSLNPTFNLCTEYPLKGAN